MATSKRDPSKAMHLPKTEPPTTLLSAVSFLTSPHPTPSFPDDIDEEEGVLEAPDAHPASYDAGGVKTCRSKTMTSPVVVEDDEARQSGQLITSVFPDMATLLPKLSPFVAMPTSLLLISAESVHSCPIVV